MSHTERMLVIAPSPCRNTMQVFRWLRHHIKNE
jgi:hypothetical protein